MIRLARRAAHVFAALALAASAVVALGSSSPATAAGSVGYMILQGEGQCALASVDLVTGAVTEIGTEASNKCVFDLEFTPDGSRLFGVRVTGGRESGGSAELVEFNLSTGAVSDVSPLGDFPIGGPGTEQGNLTFTPAGSLYTYLVPFVESNANALDPACDGSAFCLFQVNLADTTDLTYLNSVPQPFTVYFGLATSCAGTTSSVREEGEAVPVPGTDSSAAWRAVAGQAQPEQVLTTVNRTSSGPGTTDVGPVGTNFLDSLDYDTAGTLFAVGFQQETASGSLFTVDTTTGASTEVAGLTMNESPLGFGLLGFAIPHPCSAPPTPPTPPAAQPIAAVAPRFTG